MGPVAVVESLRAHTTTLPLRALGSKIITVRVCVSQNGQFVFTNYGQVGEFCSAADDAKMATRRGGRRTEEMDSASGSNSGNGGTYSTAPAGCVTAAGRATAGRR